MRVDQTQNEAYELNLHLLQELGMVSVGKGSSELHEWVTRKLREGIPITALNRLPEGRAAYVRMCLQNEGSDFAVMDHFNIDVTLRNVSGQPVRVVRSLKKQTRKVAQPRGGVYAYVDGGEWTDKEVIEVVPPGETITLSARWGLYAMQSFSRSAQPPDLWDESGSIPQRNTLIETGYTCKLDGEAHSVTHDEEAARIAETDAIAKVDADAAAKPRRKPRRKAAPKAEKAEATTTIGRTFADVVTVEGAPLV